MLTWRDHARALCGDSVWTCGTHFIYATPRFAPHAAFPTRGVPTCHFLLRAACFPACRATLYRTPHHTLYAAWTADDVLVCFGRSILLLRDGERTTYLLVGFSDNRYSRSGGTADVNIPSHNCTFSAFTLSPFLPDVWLAIWTDSRRLLLPFSLQVPDIR